MTEQEKFDGVIAKAESVFWSIIFDNYPTAESGDISVMAAIGLEEAMKEALAEWIDNNVPTTE